MKPKKLVGPLSEDSTQVRRGDQAGVPTEFPVVARKGVIAVQVDPRGAIGTDPARGLNVRTGPGLDVQSGSPFALVPVLGPGLEVSGGRIVPRLSSSVRTDTRGKLVATPTTAEVTDPDTGETAQQALARKSNVGDSRFPILTGRASLAAGLVIVLDAAVLATSVVLHSYGVLAGTPGTLSCSPSDGGFAVQSSSATDTSEVHYAVWNT